MNGQQEDNFISVSVCYSHITVSSDQPQSGIGLGSEDLCEELEDVHHVRGHVVEAGQLGRHAAAHGLAAALLRGQQPPPLLLLRPQPRHQVLLQPEREEGGLEGS